MKKQKSQTEPWTHIHQTREIPVSQPIWKSGVAAKSLPLYLFIVYYYIAYGCKWSARFLILPGQDPAPIFRPDPRSCSPRRRGNGATAARESTTTTRQRSTKRVTSWSRSWRDGWRWGTCWSTLGLGLLPHQWPSRRGPRRLNRCDRSPRRELSNRKTRRRVARRQMTRRMRHQWASAS